MYAKLAPPLVKVTPAAMVSTKGWVVKANRKLASVITAPVDVREEAATLNVRVAVGESTLMLPVSAVREVVPIMDKVAVGTPVNTTVLQDVDVAFVVVCSVIDANDALAK